MPRSNLSVFRPHTVIILHGMLPSGERGARRGRGGPGRGMRGSRSECRAQCRRQPRVVNRLVGRADADNENGEPEAVREHVQKVILIHHAMNGEVHERARGADRQGKAEKVTLRLAAHRRPPAANHEWDEREDQPREAEQAEAGVEIEDVLCGCEVNRSCQPSGLM